MTTLWAWTWDALAVYGAWHLLAAAWWFLADLPGRYEAETLWTDRQESEP